MSETDFQKAIEQQALAILDGHRGEMQRITRQELLRQINIYLESAGLPLTHDRFMRIVLEHLRGYSVEGAWICSTLKGGYFMAATKEELDEHLKNELSRVKHLLKKIGRQRKVAGLPLAGQLHLINQ